MGCCGGNAKWKREEVPDHKFDFIDVRDYRSTSFLTRLRYALMWLLVIKSFAVYIADVYTAVTLIAIGHFRSSIYDTCADSQASSNIYVPITYARWIFFGCILFSFVLLLYEGHRSRAIVRSRDISYAYTNVMANNWYSINSYNHFCFFCQINNSKKKKDEFAFFIFFTFKGWKRLLVADGPRQTINALTLYNFARCKQFSTEFSVYTDGNIMTTALLLTMLFTVLVFAASLILLAIACLMYIPLVFYIRGNLKEYCCHKIDKRISELVQFKKKQRLAKQEAIMRREAAGDFSHLRNKKGEIVGAAIPQPTLPTLDIDVLKDDGKIVPPKVKRSSVGSSIAHGVRDDMLAFPAESPAFPPVTFHGAPPPPPGSSLGHYPGSSLGHYGDYDGPMYNAEENASNAHLMAFAGPAGGSASSVHSASPDVYPVHVKGHVPGSGGLPGAGYGPSGWYADQPTQTHAQRPTPAQQNVMANAGLDYPPPPTTNGVSGLEYPPPDISAYMPYSEEQFPPVQPGYMHHSQQGSFGGASGGHEHFDAGMQSSHGYAQEPQISRSAYGNAHVEEQGISRDESSGGFFEQLNRHNQDVAHHDSGRQQRQGPATGAHYPAEHYELTAQQPYQAGSRVQSVNFEDIYAHYEER